MVGRIWRIAKTPLTLLVLLILLAIAAKWGYAQVVAPNPPPYVPPCVEQPAPDGQLKSEMISVRIFNASDQRGKAADVSQQMKAKGFKVTKVTNAKEKDPKSKVVGFSADSPEVGLVAGFFKKAEKVGDKRPDHSVEVYIGGDYEGMNADAATSVKLPGNTVCLPSPPTTAPN